MLGIFIIHADLGICISEKRPCRRIHRAFTQGVVCKVIGRADSLHEGLTDMGGQLRALSESDTVAPVIVNDGPEFVADHGEGFLPGSLFPLARTSGPGPYHGRLNPITIV